MLALETTASIADHRLVVEDDALPVHADRARVIVLWESSKPVGRRSPPLPLAGMGEEKGDILTGPPASDWETSSSVTPKKREPSPRIAGKGKVLGDIIAPAYGQAHTLSPTLDKGRGIV